jgi:hypothetical protein
MAVKFIKVAPAVRPIPPIPTLVSTPQPLLSSKYNTTPPFMNRVDLQTRVQAGETFVVGVPVNSVVSQVVGVLDAYGRDSTTVEVVEGEIAQVL